MSLDIEETLQVQAPVDKVWRFLIDPEKIVTCLPGAELTKIEDERNFVGNMKVKVGPVTVSYQGRIKMTQLDEAAHVVSMTGEGTEKGGGGSAKMTMQSTVTAKDGGSLIVVSSKVDLAGKIVQFGRGMVKGVAQQMFKQFGANLRGALETTEEAAAAPAPPPPAEPVAAEASAADASSPLSADADTSSDEKPTKPMMAQTPPPTRPLAVVPARREVQPVRIVPIILKVLFEPVSRFFGRFFRRLFGRKTKA